MIDCQIPADDLVVHLFWLWETNSLAHKPLKMGTQVKIVSLYPLGIFLADNMAGWGEQSPVYRPSIGHVEGNGKLAQQNQKTLECQSISRANYVGDDALSDTVIGIKQPALIAFTADIRPLPIGFTADNDLCPWLNVLRYLTRCKFFRWRRTVLRLIRSTLAVSRHPEPFIAISTIVWWISGLAPL